MKNLIYFRLGLILSSILFCISSSGIDTPVRPLIIGTQPDLMVESLTCDPEKPTVLNTAGYTAVIKNVGDETAGASHASIRIGSETGVKYAVPSLAPGETYSITRYKKMTVAQYYRVEAIADCNDEVDEAVEDDSSALVEGPNEKWLNVQITSNVPDLTISSITCTPEMPGTDDPFTLTVTIGNTGTGKAEANNATLKIGSESFPPKYPIPLIRKGNTFTITRDLLLPLAQQYEVEIFVDCDETIDEPDENNNRSNMTFNVVHPVKIEASTNTNDNRIAISIQSAPNSSNTLYSCSSLSTGTWEECSSSLTTEGAMELHPVFTDYTGDAIIFVEKQSASSRFFKIVRDQE